MSNPRSVLAVRNLRKSIHSGTHRVDILRGIDFAIPAGQFAAVEGPSGSGKSTLLGLLAGLDTPTSGDVSIDGQSIVGLAEDETALLRGRKIGFVFQSYQLVPTLNAVENVTLPLDLAGSWNSHAEKRAVELLEQFGLGDRLDHYPVQLSGGEQQRVAVARAFAGKPPIVLADEPTGNLDSRNGALVMEMLRSLNRTEGATLILVTHDAALAAQADRRIALKDGLVVSDVVRGAADAEG